jgi:hypothetical protein
MSAACAWPRSATSGIRPGLFEASAFSGGADLDDLFDEIGADVELQ